MKLQTKAFTLVELIVVITILAILGTIAFISLQGFSRDARDSARITDLKSIEKGFEILLTQDQSLPKPENSVNITASGTTISYQGYAGEKVMGTAKVFGGGKDPLDNTYYTYVADTNLRNYELMGFLENGDSIALNTNLLNQTQANDYSTRYPIVKGKPLGIIVNPTTKEPIQTTGSGIDLVTETNEYEVYLDNSSSGSITGTGGALKSAQLNASCKRIKEINLNSKDGIYTINPEGTNPIEVYCDMTTDGGGWTLVLKADGNKQTFPYNSSYWINNTTLNESSFYYDNIEFKSPLFSNMSFDKVNLELVTNGVKKNIFIDKKANSLMEVFNGSYQPINISKEKWMSLVPGSLLQPNCNLGGFNAKSNRGARIGFSSNDENDCDSNDSYIGIGIDPWNYQVPNLDSTVGNNCGSSKCTDINGNINSRIKINSFGYLYIK